MNIIDLRNRLQTSSAYQNDDRRRNPYPYGSPEWTDYMRKNGFTFPTHDRRNATRRTNLENPPSSSAKSEKPYIRILLSSNEKKLLADMYLIDFENLNLDKQEKVV